MHSKIEIILELEIAKGPNKTKKIYLFCQQKQTSQYLWMSLIIRPWGCKKVKTPAGQALTLIRDREQGMNEMKEKATL